MNTAKIYSLIKGTFTAEEAGKVLLELIQRKIEYHNLQILSKKIRFDQSPDQSEKRIDELKEIKTSLQRFLREAEDHNWLITVDCPLSVRAINNAEEQKTEAIL